MNVPEINVGGTNDNPKAPDGHDEKMLKVAEDAGEVTPDGGIPDKTPEAMPEGGHEKFYDTDTGVYNWKDHATELKFRLDGKAPSAKTEDLPADGTKAPGLDLTKYAAEYSKDGTLSEVSYKELAEMGLNKTYVDTYIEGLTANAAATRKGAFDAVGGEEKYGEMVKWAGANLSTEEVEAFNKAIHSPDPSVVSLVAQGLFSKFTEANGSAPAYLEGDGGGGGRGDVYESAQQLQKDMANPDYEKDPAFRKMVAEKLDRSDIMDPVDTRLS